MNKSTKIERAPSPLINALTSQSNSLIKSFTIFGFPHTTSPTTPKPEMEILYHTPKEFQFPQKAEDFIVPRKPTIQQISPNFDILRQPNQKYITILPNDNDSLLCICIYHNEFLNIVNDLINPTQITNELYRSDYYTQRIYCFTTNYPYLNALFPILDKFIDKGYRQKINYFYTQILKSITLNFNPNPIKSILDAYIQKVLRMTTTNEENIVFKDDINKYTFLRSKVNTLKDPLHVSMKMLADYCLVRLFMTLSIDNILHLLKTMLCGTGVIIISEDISVATSCLFGLLALFFPFVWQGVIIPYVPDDLYEFYETPVPLLCAGKYPPIKCSVNAYVFELGQSYLSFFTSKVSKHFDSLPDLNVKLPYYREVKTHLNNTVDSFIKRKPSAAEREKYIEMMPQEQIIAFSEKIMSVMYDQLYFKMEDLIIRKNYALNYPSLDDFVAQFPKVFSPDLYGFMKKFAESQHFNTWWYEVNLRRKELKTKESVDNIEVDDI